MLYHGRFPFMSSKWQISGASGEQVGVLRSRMAFLSKKYTYETDGRGTYEIVSPAFSKEYEVTDESGTYN